MGGMSRPDIRQLQPEPAPDYEPDLAAQLVLVSRGDHRAFELVYGELAGPVYGVVRQVLRDPAQSEEVAQEVLLEIWRTASRFDPARGSAAAWALTIAHRRAVDRVRSENASSRREQKAAEPEPAEDDVAETVAATLEHQRVRRCMGGADRAAARVDQARLLQRILLPAGREAARGRPRHGQDQDQGRIDQDA